MALCRELDLLSAASVAIDGSKFKAVNARDKNFTEAKMKRRLERIDESITRYLAQLETADRRGDAVPEARVVRFKDKIAKLEEVLDSRAKCNRALREPDLHVFAKVFEDCLKRSLEAKAFSGREISGDDDVLDFLVGHFVDVDLTRQPAS